MPRETFLRVLKEQQLEMEIRRDLGIVWLTDSPSTGDE